MTHMGISYNKENISMDEIQYWKALGEMHRQIVWAAVNRHKLLSIVTAFTVLGVANWAIDTISKLV